METGNLQIAPRIPLPVTGNVDHPAAAPCAGAAELSEQLVRILPRLRKHVGARSARESHEDVVQETLLRALQSHSSFRADSDPWPWVRTIADRVAIRRSERERLAPGPMPDDAVEPAARTAGAAEVAVENAESARALLARLQGPERHALERFYLDGMSVAEIAAAESSPLGTIKARLSRGRGRLLVLGAAALGTALTALMLVRAEEEPGSVERAGATGSPTPTLHYAWSTTRVIPAYEPKLQTVHLPTRTTIEWTVE